MCHNVSIEAWRVSSSFKRDRIERGEAHHNTPGIKLSVSVASDGGLSLALIGQQPPLWPLIGWRGFVCRVVCPRSWTRFSLNFSQCHSGPCTQRTPGAQPWQQPVRSTQPVQSQQ